MNNGGGDTNNNDAAAGGTRDGDDPQHAGNDVNPLEKIIFTYKIIGGPVAHWGLDGRFQAVHVLHIANLMIHEVILFVRYSWRN